MEERIKVEAPDYMAREALRILSDRNEINERVVYKLINKIHLRPDEIYDPWKNDIVITYRVQMDNDKCMVINETFLEQFFDGNMKYLRQKAKENTQMMAPAVFISTGEIMGFIGIPEEDNTFYILTNEAKMFGASSILYPNIFDLIRTKVKGRFWLVPSSVHEFIIIPVDDIEYADILGILNEANNTVVNPDDVLSDEILFVDESNRIYSKNDVLIMLQQMLIKELKDTLYN